MVTVVGLPPSVIWAKVGTLLEGFIIVCCRGKLEMELEAASLLQVAFPDLPGFVRTDAGNEEDERVVVWPYPHEGGWDVIRAVVQEMGMQELFPII